MANDLHRLAQDFEESGRRARTLAERAVRKTALDVSATAKSIAPVDTGNLKNSIGMTVTSTADEITAEVGPTAHYGVFLEYGTSRMAPQPYLGPAFDKHISQLEDALQVIVDGV